MRAVYVNLARPDEARWHRAEILRVGGSQISNGGNGMTQLQNILNQFFGVRGRPVQRERNTKRVEYWIHRAEDADYGMSELEILYGDEWRKARKIAADPPDDVWLVERVLVWDNGNQEYQTLFERRSHAH